MKRILITGTTSGLGKATAYDIAEAGHQVIMAVRNMDKGRQLKEELMKSTNNPNIDVMYLDLSSFESIMAFAKTFHNKYAYLDVLINNAGVFSDVRAYTEEGYELTLGVNYVGQFLLTKLLIGSLKVSGHSRVVNVSSKAGFHGKLDLKTDAFLNHPHGFKAYAASKMAQLMFTIYYGEQLKDLGIDVNAVHPGAVATNIWTGQSLLMKLIGPINKRRYAKPEDACKTVVHVALDDELTGTTGCFFENLDQKIPFPERVRDENLIQTLMVYSDELIRPYI